MRGAVDHIHIRPELAIAPGPNGYILLHYFDSPKYTEVFCVHMRPSTLRQFAHALAKAAGTWTNTDCSLAVQTDLLGATLTFRTIDGEPLSHAITLSTEEVKQLREIAQSLSAKRGNPKMMSLE